jgi:hypothetical protein
MNPPLTACDDDRVTMSRARRSKPIIRGAR